MPHEYTRQRQGRDFSLQEYLAKSAEENRKSEENEKNIEIANKTLAHRLEHFKGEAERNAVPVDGHEPPERGRNLV